MRQPASACQPDHRKLPTAQTAGPIASILSQSKRYFCPHVPFLFLTLPAPSSRDYFHLQCLAFFFVKVETFDTSQCLTRHTEPVIRNIKHVQVLYKVSVIVSKCATRCAIVVIYRLRTLLHVRITSGFSRDSAYGLDIISASQTKLRLKFYR